MIVIHHLNDSRSQRVLWLLEELGLKYQIRHYQRDAKTRLAPAELMAVHPLGKAPVLTDDGQTVFESGAIVDYLIRHHGEGRLQPSVGWGLDPDEETLWIVDGSGENRRLAGPTFGELLAYLRLGWSKRDEVEEDFIGALMLRAKIRADRA